MSHRIREKIKTFVLLILFATAILFLYLLWPESTDGFNLFNSSSSADETEEIKYQVYELISPDEVLLSNYNNSIAYVKSGSEIFERSVKQIKNMCDENECAIVSISNILYEEAKENYQSLSMHFAYEIDFEEFADYAGLKTGRNFDIIDKFDTIMYTAAYKGSVFFKNSETGDCYRMAGKSYTYSMEELTAEPETDGYRYIKISEIMGVGEIRIPYAVSVYPSSVQVSSKVLSESQSESLARVLFGKSFDFARKVVDTVGNTSYMYGYGQKLLKINKNGELEYRAELSEKNKNSLMEDLAVSKNLIDTLSLENINGLEFVLDNIKVSDEEGSSIRRFEYAQSKNGIKILDFAGSPAIVIEVENGQIVNFVQNAYTAVAEIDNKSLDIEEPARVIAENCMEIYNKLFSAENKNEETAYSYVCENTDSVKLKYVKEGSRIVPKWEIIVSGQAFYYSYY